MLILILSPLVGFLINAFRFKSSNKKLSGQIAILACLGSFLATLFHILNFGFSESRLYLFPWFSLGDINLNFSFLLDSLSLLMCLLITGVGSLIHIYSFFYMSKEDGFTRYFIYLNLFIFMMLILVLADSLPLLFVGWEGVGLCSYLLIGFWFKEEKKLDSGLLAFIVNRLGDACFLLGIFFLFVHVKTFNFTEINSFFKEEMFSFSNPSFLGPLLIFLGATGKSAQFPLYFWLPKAMAGPTPVSALIHAATMVTAGVYLLVRMSFCYMAFPFLLEGIAWIGAVTALGAALIACRSWDFKSILAYSTISQLAYLFIAIGVKAFSASIFHLLTHGFFKALLFLCAGSVIHALNGEQDIRKMGGLKKKLPITYLTYMIGAFALMAIPPFSGFFSKDEILWSLYSSKNYLLFCGAFFTGLITCFYMTRLTAFVFFGKEKTPAHKEERGLNIPLIILAFFAFFSGVLGIPHALSEFLAFKPPHILQELLKDFSPSKFKGSFAQEISLMLSSTLMSLAVIGGSFFIFLKKKFIPFPSKLKQVLEEAFFVPHLISRIQVFFKKICLESFKQVELSFFNQAIHFLISQVLTLKTIFSKLQNGSIQSYLFYFTIGLTIAMVLIFLN
ncbi:MAG: NADH-quinone oxidoreductase subunit L [Bdellovibrionaceae bacterium]|nr:NADH-quinone oxidoreductase subunit L [Pseudobdellovibrionaceae bacterium]